MSIVVLSVFRQQKMVNSDRFMFAFRVLNDAGVFSGSRDIVDECRRVRPCEPLPVAVEVVFDVRMIKQVAIAIVIN